MEDMEDSNNKKSGSLSNHWLPIKETNSSDNSNNTGKYWSRNDSFDVLGIGSAVKLWRLIYEQ